jgi:predicted ribosomally synthesized peptide with nif11-like leader
MSEIKRFSEDLGKNKEMMEEIRNFGSDVAKIVAYANSKGYNFTVADIDSQKSELSEEQLDKVAGGGGGVIVAW